MSLQDHTIRYGDDERTLAEWGIHAATVNVNDRAEDRLVLSAALEPSGAPLWPRHAAILLKDSSGTIRFNGIVGCPALSAKGGKRSHVYTVESPTWYLSRLIYRQKWPFPVSPSNVLGETEDQYVSQVILHRQRDEEEGEVSKINVRQQVNDILDYAVTVGLVPITYATGAIPTVEPPEDEQLDLRIVDALDTTLGWTPDVQRHWVYSAGLPRLQFSRIAFSPLAPLAILPEGVPGYFQLRTVDLGELEDFTARGRDDLLVPKYRVTYITTNQSGENVWRSVHRDESEVLGAGWGTMESTVQLRGLELTPDGWGDPEPRPADGLAAALHRPFSRLLYELSFSRTTDNCQWDLWPGEVWNITGAGTGLETAMSVCKSITRDLRIGRVDVECGLGSTLSLSGRLQLLRPNRKRQKPVNAGEQSYGFGDEEEQRESNLEESVLAWLHVAGALARYRVKMRPSPPT